MKTTIPSREAAKKVFSAIPVATIYPAKQVITVKDTTTIPEVFYTLVTNNILSVPILDSKSGGPLGFVDMVDLVAFVVKIGDVTSRMGSFKKVLAQDKLFVDAVSIQVSDLSRRNPYRCVSSTSSIWDVIEVMARTSAHRVAVEDLKDGRLVGLATQSEVMGHVGVALAKIPDWGNSTLASLGLGDAQASPVVVGKSSESALAVFQKMSSAGFSALPIVGPTGQLMACISSKDLRVIASGAHLFDTLRMPILTYIQKANEEVADLKAPTITCRAKDLLKNVVARMVVARVHRIFLIDDRGKAIRVISLRDILKVFVGPKKEEEYK